LLTLAETEKTNQKIYYTAIELYPLKQEEASALNYCEQVSQPDLKPLFDKFHICEWEKEVGITPFFTLFKNKQSFLDFETEKLGHLIYFDAFAPSAQPELWAKEVFEKIYKALFPDGVLVTYCSKGDVRRAMIKAGFSVEKIQGPPGKREMLRAVKL
jgi:tRNA U34 5-methylaminomethyl-2-thiouridine-forming methyltransferase MnmC